MRHLRFAFLTIAGLTLACAPTGPNPDRGSPVPLAHVPLAPSRVDTASSTPGQVEMSTRPGNGSEQNHRASTASGVTVPQGNVGTLVISVRWPRAIQTLPASTNLVSVSVESATGAALASASLTPSDGPVSTTRIQLPAGQNLTVKASAFQDATVLASGSATASIVANERTPLALTLVPVNVPTVTGVTPNGGPNALVEVTGTNFGFTRGLRPPIVVFGTATSSRVIPVSDTALKAQVPASSGAGLALTVVVDGVPSMPSSMKFSALSSLGIATLNPILTLGGTISIRATGTTAAGTVPDPMVDWSLFTGPGAPIPVTLSQSTGPVVILTGAKSGTATLVIRSGDLSASTSVTVQ